MKTANQHRAVTFAIVLAAALTACGGSVADSTTTSVVSETTAPTETMTTAPPTTTRPDATTTLPETTTTVEGQLTPEAAATLESIRAAAVEGDLTALAELALSFDTMFTASFGQTFSDPADLATFWNTFQDPTVPEVVLGLLDAGYTRTLANNEDGSQVGINVTPAVMGEAATEADRDRLESIFGVDTVAGWYADGMYLGWRLGVDDNGVWRFLVIGD